MHTRRTFGAWCKRYIKPGFMATLAILIFVTLGTDNSMLETYGYDQEIDELRGEIARYNDTLQYYRQLNHNLTTDPVTMERIVREHYHMQRPGEEVYIMTRQNQ